MIYFFTCMKKLKAARCIYHYVFYARMKRNITEKESKRCVFREMALDTEIVTYLISRCSLYMIVSYSLLLWVGTRDVPLCDSLWNILRCTAQRYTFRTLNSTSLLWTGMAHYTLHPCFSCSRQVLVTAVLQEAILVTKADSIPTVVRGMAAVQQVLPYSWQVSVWILCETSEPQDFRRMWLFRIVKSRRW
jgi:hypothetical protein